MLVIIKVFIRGYTYHHNRNGIRRVYILMDAPLASFDWRNHNGGNWLTPVKSQGGRGSCWVFSSVGVVEAAHNIAGGNPDLDLNLSEQYLVSDCLSYNNCCGGRHDTALQ